MESKIDIARALEVDGFTVVPVAIDPEAVDRLLAAVESLTRAAAPSPATLRRRESLYGARDLLRLVPEVRSLAHSSAIRRLVEPVLGPCAFPVRALLFDKTPAANWSVPWHRDLMIAVRERRDAPGYGPWTRKAGVPHVRPPLDVLRGMLTVRIHLDDCGPDDGPLAVIPRSHSGAGEGEAEETDRRLRCDLDPPAATCLVPRGGAVLMRPLILHASGSARVPGHRRVIHLEYAAEDLPGGLEWAEAGPDADCRLDQAEVPGQSPIPTRSTSIAPVRRG